MNKNPKPIPSNPLQAQAEELTNQKDSLAHFIQRAYQKAMQNKDRIKDIFSDLKILLQMVMAWAKGDYKETPWTSIVAALVAIIYFVNPIDLIPDFLGLGFVDDAFVITQVWAYIKTDIDKFNHWKTRHEVSLTLH